METTLRQTWAFLFRGYHLTRRYISWVIVFNFYALVTSATVALIGVATHDYQLTLTLVVGALLWNFLSMLYNEIAMSIAYERWEGTLEYTFMAPVSRLIHLFGISLFSLINSIVQTVIVLIGLMLFTDLNFQGANIPGVLVVRRVRSHLVFQRFHDSSTKATIISILTTLHGRHPRVAARASGWTRPSGDDRQLRRHAPRPPRVARAGHR